MNKDDEITDVAIIENNNYIEKADKIDTDTILHNIKAQGEIFDALQSYVKSHMVENIDFGVIPGCAKPSLWKAGAEKINFMFNLVPKYEILKETETSTEYTYKIRCELFNKFTGKFMGSGLGYASTREKKFANAPANTVLKMAKKRSYIDATLSATMASFLFTQDIIEEDDTEEVKKETKKQLQTQQKTQEKTAQEFDWSKIDLNKKPYWGYGNKRKTPKIIARIFAISKDLIPAEELKSICKNITGKEHSWEWTYGDIKQIFEAIEQIKNSENQSNSNGNFENFDDFDNENLEKIEENETNFNQKNEKKSENFDENLNEIETEIDKKSEKNLQYFEEKFDVQDGRKKAEKILKEKGLLK